MTSHDPTAGRAEPGGAERRQDEQPGAHAPAPVDLSEESVAGEEDPGAALDTGIDAPVEPTPPRRSSQAMP